MTGLQLFFLVLIRQEFVDEIIQFIIKPFQQFVSAHRHCITIHNEQISHGFLVVINQHEGERTGQL